MLPVGAALCDYCSLEQKLQNQFAQIWNKDKTACCSCKLGWAACQLRLYLDRGSIRQLGLGGGLLGPLGFLLSCLVLEGLLLLLHISCQVSLLLCDALP